MLLPFSSKYAPNGGPMGFPQEAMMCIIPNLKALLSGGEMSATKALTPSDIIAWPPVIKIQMHVGYMKSLENSKNYLPMMLVIV